MPDGTFLEGAEGNKPDGILTDFPSGRPPDRKFLDSLWIDFGAPWIQPRADFERSMLALRYHSKEDNLSQPVDKEAAAQFDSFLADLTRRVANNPQRPHYLESSFFRRFEK